MSRTHLILMEDLCQVFQLHSANEDLLIELVQNLLAENKRKEVHVHNYTCCKFYILCVPEGL